MNFIQLCFRLFGCSIVRTVVKPKKQRWRTVHSAFGPLLMTRALWIIAVLSWSGF